MPCKNAQCQIDSDGKCLEGFADPAECPHYSAENLEEPAAEAQSPATSDPNDIAEETEEDTDQEKLEASEEQELEVALADGGPLGIDLVTKRLCSTGARRIAIIGGTGSGKTTLISSIYDLLGRGPFEGYGFAGSDTLNAYEQFCHLARASSGRTTPDTEHTSRRSGLSFMHLALVRISNGQKIHILFSDRSGEEYEAAADKRDICRELIEVERADLILLLVDAEKLVDSVQRHPALAQSRTIIEALIDGGLIRANQRLVVTLTKFDVIKDQENETEIVDLFSNSVEKIKNRFGDHFGEIIEAKIASRPNRPTVEPGFGLNMILDACASQMIVLPHVQDEELHANRAFHSARVRGS